MCCAWLDAKRPFFGPSESSALQTLEFKLERTLLSLVSHDFFNYELIKRPIYRHLCKSMGVNNSISMCSVCAGPLYMCVSMLPFDYCGGGTFGGTLQLTALQLAIFTAATYSA